MIKLATVFSGIGAIEHALERTGFDYEIAFACDNGDVDIFKKQIDHRMIAILREIDYLSNKIKTLDFNMSGEYEYLTNLEEHLNRIKEKVKELDGCSLELSIDENIKSIVDFEDGDKHYNTLIASHKKLKYELRDKTSDIVLLLYELSKHIDEEDSKASEFNEKIKKFLNTKEAKDIRHSVSEIVDELHMLHEKIETLKVLSDLRKIEDPKEKKAYVDNLYKGKEKSNFVRKTYFANYDIDDSKFHWNTSFLDGSHYRDKIDLFVGGSPCQSFSMVGKRRGLDDTRGTLFYEFARLVKEIQPKVFIYENVRAVLSNDGGRTWQTMQQVFDDLHYKWEWTTLNAKDYGIPQNRERLFVVGFRDDLVLNEEFKFPDPIELTKTMKDFLIDNVSGKYYLNKKGVDFVTDDKNLKKRFTQIDGKIQLCQKKNQQFNWHGDFVFVEENKDKEKTMHDLEKYFLSEKVKKYVLASGTKNFYSRPQIDLDVARPLLTTMHKMHRAGIDNYVTTEGRLRKLTPRECLRLMGFCDSFKIVVSDTQMYQQAGNSIVVDVLVNIIKKVVQSLPQIVDGEGYEYQDVKYQKYEQMDFIAADKDSM